MKGVREEQIPYFNTYIWNLEKVVLMNLFAGKEWRRRYREQTCGHSGQRREWEDGESSINIYTLLCVK